MPQTECVGFSRSFAFWELAWFLILLPRPGEAQAQAFCAAVTQMQTPVINIRLSFLVIRFRFARLSWPALAACQIHFAWFSMWAHSNSEAVVKVPRRRDFHVEEHLTRFPCTERERERDSRIEPESQSQSQSHSQSHHHLANRPKQVQPRTWRQK